MSALPSFAYPGLALSNTKHHLSGPGTYISPNTNTISASLSGTPISTVPTQGSLPVISIQTPASNSTTAIPSRQISRHNILPSVNVVVLARVTRLQQRQANLAILVVDNQPCADEFAGVVRREDVRGWEIDKVKIEESFRVGDIVRAVVISLGDQSSYYLSTARNELGVLLATSEAGNQMVPISWRMFRDPVTGNEEVSCICAALASRVLPDCDEKPIEFSIKTYHEMADDEWMDLRRLQERYAFLILPF